MKEKRGWGVVEGVDLEEFDSQGQWHEEVRG